MYLAHTFELFKAFYAEIPYFVGTSGLTNIYIVPHLHNLFLFQWTSPGY